MKQTLYAALVLLALIPGCATNADPPDAIDVDAERAALLERDGAVFTAYSTSETPVDTLLAHFTDDANVLAPGAPIARGKEASRAVFATLQALPGYSLRWRASEAGVGGAGDLGYTIGTYHMEFEDPEGGAVVVDGKFLTVWKRQPDGTWKIAVDMFNDNGAVAADAG